MFDSCLYHASLSGSDEIELAIGLSPNVEYMDLWVKTKTPFRAPAFPAEIVDCSYDKPDTNSINQLLNGDSTAEFSFGGCAFSMVIYQGRWGVRTGFVVELIYNINELNGWPDRRSLSRYLLAGRGSAFQTQFAFLCEFENLERFLNELQKAFTV